MTKRFGYVLLALAVLFIGSVLESATGSIGNLVGTTFNLANSKPLAVAVVDGSGDQLTSFAGGGGGTQYAEDTAHVSGDSVTLAGTVQVATCGTGLSTDGDRSVLQVDTNGQLCVSSSAVTTALDNTVVTIGTVSAAEGLGVVIVDPDDGSAVSFGSLWQRDIPVPVDADAPGLLLRGITAATDQVTVDDSFALATSDHYGSMRILPSVGGVDATMTVTGRLDTTVAGQFEDEDSFTYGTSRVVPFGAIAESTTDTLSDGQVGSPVMTLSRFLRMTPSGYLSGGGTGVRMLSDNTNNDDLTAICTGPCTVYNVIAFNHASTPAYLSCENDTTGNTTPGSETASDGEIFGEIPGNTAGSGFVFPISPVGVSYGTALSCWIHTGEAESDATDAATDDVRVFFVRVQ